MQLWELLFLVLWSCLCFFGSMWAFRILAIILTVKAVGGAVSGVKDKLKGVMGNE